MSQVTQCDVCKKVEAVGRPILQERSTYLEGEDGSTFEVAGSDMRMSYYFTLPTGEYYQHQKIDICTQCAEKGLEDAFRAANGTQGVKEKARV
tara:strand:+ start:95 stop:373 length:279 start_codon:yes stop_codon:yes gene_type:complete